MANSISPTIQNKIDDLCDLLDEIKVEIECLEADFFDMDDSEKTQCKKDLPKIDSHLRKTANLFSHLTGVSSPDWKNK